MSMPSSSEDVATRHGIWPAFSSSSTTSRCSRASEPWCARASSSPASSLMRSASRSARRRLFTKTIVERCCSDEVEDRGVDRGPDRPARPFDTNAHLDPVCERRDRERGRRRQLSHVLDRNDDLEVQLLADAHVDELDLSARSGDEATDLLHRSLGRREPKALERSVDEALESLERERQMRAALRAGDCVHLVEDHGLDPAQRLACLRGEEQEQRLGRGDEDVRRGPQHSAPLLRRSVPRAHRDRELRVEPGERASQVPLDVVVQRLERRDVEKAQAVPGRLVEAVDADQERSERLSRARGRLDEHVIAARNRRPSEQLCGCRLGEGALEPDPRPRREDVQRRHPARVPPSPYPRPVRFDVLVVGGGTAGCILASRLSENTDRRVCLLEAGPDYGPLRRWRLATRDPLRMEYPDHAPLGIGGC